MSIRAQDGGKPPAPPALKKWPKPPRGFKPLEVAEWSEIGAACMVIGTVSAADLPIAQDAARVSARVSELFDDPDLKASTLAGMLRIKIDLFKQLGLSPQSRRQVTPLQDDAEDEDDPLAEFDRKPRRKR